MMVDHKLLETLSKLTPEETQRLLGSLSVDEALAILDDWSLWSLPYQKLPEGNWRRWVLRAGRGSGKTYGASKNINEIAKDRSKIKTGEIGIIARTHSDARYTCVEGPSGILATAPHDFRPIWHPGHGLLVWPNGVKGRIFSADKPESLRGPNWAVIWADEVCHWMDPKKIWWETIEPALRIGWARAIITTTPLPDGFLEDLESKKDTVVTRASTYDNKWLSKEVLAAFKEHYEDTRLGDQELYGEYIEELAGSLWRSETIEKNRVSRVPQLTRVIISVDPAVTAKESSSETGIIVLGVDKEQHVYVLEDVSGRYEPLEWAKKVVVLFHRYQADRVIAEINQGGDLVEANLRVVDRRISYSSVRAWRGKVLRAEPVAACYERGLIHHVGVHKDLEDQQVTWVPGRPSPDRIDALVHGITHLILADKHIGPISAYL